MKRVIQSTLVLVVMISIFRVYIVSSLHDEKIYAFTSKVTTLLIGDSHAQYGFNDKLIPNSLNLSFRSEKFIWTYRKLQNLLKYNKQIRKIVLSVSYHSFGKGNDEEILGAERSFFYRRYGSLFEQEDYQLLFEEKIINKELLQNFLKFEVGIPIEGYREIKNSLTQKAFNKRNEAEFLGYYQDDSENILTDKRLESTISRHFQKSGRSFIQELYFEKIVKLVRSKGIELLLVTLPLHEKYIRKIPLEHKRILKSSLYSSQKEGAKYIDLSTLQMKNEYFKDFDHLNTNGARYIAENYLRRM